MQGLFYNSTLSAPDTLYFRVMSTRPVVSLTSITCWLCRESSPEDARDTYAYMRAERIGSAYPAFYVDSAVLEHRLGMLRMLVLPYPLFSVSSDFDFCVYLFPYACLE